ncbi:hypothetical protein D9758_001255 [Tetrapyrgos nigripes]|uniref:CUE domain-containing protein n=1 Tax=Tetrapyrgos nigripes TaxID=182062 RepID=A0A8H5GRA5_9AGAR|nr:hypothetical protein D9758_001255 [Tetrapyrgos nigripes]
MSTDSTKPTANPFESNPESNQAQPHDAANPPTNVTTPPVAIPSVTTPSNEHPQSASSTPEITPQTTRPESTPQTTQERDAPIDPRVSALRAMFPDFDDAVLLSVLESVGGNQDRAIDVLLGMNDPDYHSELPPQEPVLSQTELDERFARQLFLEDEQRQQQRQAAWEAQQRSTQSQPPNTGERDTMTEIGEQFNKIAESGKKTFGSIYSRVKAKIQELDQPRPPPSSSTGSGTAAQSQTQYQQFQGHSQQQQQPAYYDPNPQSPDVATAQGYDVIQSPDVESSAKNGGTTSSGTSPPPATSTGSDIDSGKLGLLPKRPVSLLRAENTPGQTQPQPATRRDSDELEYAENPFEEGRK